MADVDFFFEDINQFKVPKPIRTRRWIRSVIRKEKRTLSHLNFIFCSDEYLLSINQQYLRHNTFTDIITFDNSEEPRTIEGDIFISIERVRENADTRQIAFEDELNRVMVHGVLHLIGYKDKSNDDKALMRKKEDAYLSLRIVSEK
jgi:probable rRNA maturation factor